jgi:glycosyltransferase involved in cell wall biosynthesis
VRVLFVTDSPTVSGAEHVWLGYLRALQPPGRAAHVFLSGTNQRLIHELEARQIPYAATRAYSRRLLETTIDPTALVEYARAFARVHRELSRVIAAFRPTVIHSISYPASLYATSAALASRTPQLWHEHNIKRIHVVNRRLYRLVARSCAWVVGPSRAVVDNLARAGLPAGKLVALYNGIDLSRFTPDDARAWAIREEYGLAADQPAVGLFGQFLPHKGHLTLIEAAGRIRERFQGVRFLLVGALENPPYERELRARLADLGVQDAFIFTGWRPDVAHVMRAMDVCVVATTTPEPAALSLMEAMAMGRPLVATSTGGTPEIVDAGVTGLLFPAGDALALADRVCRLLADPAERARMGEAGRARVAALFGEERHVEAMMNLWERAATRTSRPAQREPRRSES